MPSVTRPFSGSAGLKMKIIGVNRLTAAIGARFGTATAKARLVGNASGLLVEAEAKRLITNGYYQPAIKTGTLRRSVTHEIVRASPFYIETAIGTTPYYGIYVHEGTIHMKDRPYLVDALRNKRNEILLLFRKIFNV